MTLTLKQSPPFSAPLPPGSWMGLLGGGQLGRMLCHAGQQLGYKMAVLDPAADSPAAMVADHHIQAKYEDALGLRELARRCTVITTEFENVPAKSLRTLATHCRVSPAAQTVATVQDRITEKAFITSQGLAVAPYVAIHDAAELAQVPASLFPGILKVARLGYDGKGQVQVQTCAQALTAFTQLGQVACVLEALQPLAHEISVIIARGFDGATVTFPVAYNVHRHGILAASMVKVITTPEVMTSSEGMRPSQVMTSSEMMMPPNLSACQGDTSSPPPHPSGPHRATSTLQYEQQAVEAARHLADRLDYHGVLCVEFFVLRNGKLLVNEIAPRPHNSGHYTLDACVTSQFEQQARIMAGLPLGSTNLLAPAIMLNILGDAWYQGDAQTPCEPNWIDILTVPHAKLHLYGKYPPRVGRKMGHVTIIGPSAAQTCHDANRIAALLGIPEIPMSDKVHVHSSATGSP